MDGALQLGQAPGAVSPLEVLEDIPSAHTAFAVRHSRLHEGLDVCDLQLTPSSRVQAARWPRTLLSAAEDLRGGHLAQPVVGIMDVERGRRSHLRLRVSVDKYLWRHRAEGAAQDALADARAVAHHLRLPEGTLRQAHAQRGPPTEVSGTLEPRIAQKHIPAGAQDRGGGC